MQLALYVHPFDVTALASHGGLSRLRDLGFTELSIATSYHAGRWLTPWNDERRVRFLEDGTVHFRPRGEAYGRLLPLTSSEVPADGPSPLEALCRDANASGMSVRAWTVFGHNTRLGELHPELCVENACGDRYPYALCPSQPDVQQYHLALLRDLAAHDGLTTIELEALGQMGIQHSSHHDKKSFDPKGLLAFALSACFCGACRATHAALDQDADALRGDVRAFLQQRVTDGDAMAPEPEPAADELPESVQRWVDAVLAVRAETMRRFAPQVVEASGERQRAVQVHPDPWFTGSQLAAAAATAFPVPDERVLTCYGMSADKIAALCEHAGMRDVAASPQRLCIWPKAPEFTSDEDLVKVRRLCARRGVASLAVYHLGLLPWRTIERVAKMMTT